MQKEYKKCNYIEIKGKSAVSGLFDPGHNTEHKWGFCSVGPIKGLFVTSIQFASS